MQKHIRCPLPFRGGLGRGSRGYSSHSFLFRKWIGRTLSKYELQLITRLERHRRQHAVKVHIVDTPGHNSEQLIIDYMRYLQEIYPTQPCVIYAKTKAEAKLIAQDFPGTVYPASVKRPFSIRGMNYDMVLAINPPERYLTDILRTVMPVVCSRPGCIVIFLTTPPSLQGRAGVRLQHPLYRPEKS